MEGKFFVNPGSATGAPNFAADEDLAGTDSGYGGAEEEEEEGGDADATVPSFVLMDVQGEVLVLYVYQLKRDAEGKESVGVEKVSFRKEGKGA